MSHAFIKRAGAAAFADEAYAEIELVAGDCIARLVGRACAAFPSWAVDAGQVALFLAMGGGDDEPSADDERAALAGARLQVGWTFERAGVAAGAWLLARVPPPARAALAARAPPPVLGPIYDVVELLGEISRDPLPAAQAFALRFHASFEGARAALHAGALMPRDAWKLRAQLRAVLSCETRARFSLASGGVVLGEPLSAATCQAGTAVRFALRGARALCAKVGPRDAVRREWAAMEAVHGGGAHAPAVVRAEACEDVPCDRGLAALIMPLLPLSVADASWALPPGPGRARDTLAASVALCGLAAVAAFARAGWAHGDIKPANMMLAGGASAACVLVDLGAARAVGEGFTESSGFSLREPLVASARYDLVCLGATLAALQHELYADDGETRASLLASVRAAAAAAAAAAGARPPASHAAEACLALGARAGCADVSEGELRALAEDVAAAAAAAGLDAPLVGSVWPR